MTQSLRLAYPQSYAAFAAVAEASGIHVYDFTARISEASDGLETVTLAHLDKAWTRSAHPKDWAEVSADVQAFFQRTADAMKVALKKSYSEWLNNRDV